MKWFTSFLLLYAINCILYTDLNSRRLFTTVTGVYGVASSGKSNIWGKAAAIKNVLTSSSLENSTSTLGTLVGGLNDQYGQIVEHLKSESNKQMYINLGIAVGQVVAVGIGCVPGIGPIASVVLSLGLNVIGGALGEEKPDEMKTLLNGLTSFIDKAFDKHEQFITKALSGLKFDLMMLDYKLDIQAPLDNYRYLIKYAFTPNSTDEGNEFAMKQLQNACSTGGSSLTLLAQKFRKYLECQLTDPTTNDHTQKLLSNVYRRAVAHRHLIDVHHILQNLNDSKVAKEHVSSIISEITSENPTFETKADAAAHVLRHLVKRGVKPGKSSPCLPDAFLKSVEYEYEHVWSFLSAIVLDAGRLVGYDKSDLIRKNQYYVVPFCAGTLGFPQQLSNEKKVAFFMDIVTPINETLKQLNSYMEQQMIDGFYNEMPNKIRGIMSSVKFTEHDQIYENLHKQLGEMLRKSEDDDVYKYGDVLFYAKNMTAFEWRSTHSDCISVTYSTDANNGEFPCDDVMNGSISQCARYLYCRTKMEDNSPLTAHTFGKIYNPELLNRYAEYFAWCFDQYKTLPDKHWIELVNRTTPYFLPTLVIHTDGFSTARRDTIVMFPIADKQTHSKKNYYMYMLPRAVYTKRDMEYAIKNHYLCDPTKDCLEIQRGHINPWDDRDTEDRWP